MKTKKQRFITIVGASIPQGNAVYQSSKRSEVQQTPLTKRRKREKRKRNKKINEEKKEGKKKKKKKTKN